MSRVPNIGRLKDYTIFITGASRGIGLEMAKKCAADGANIVVAAKTSEPHAKLPGTIYTAAAEIEKAGGKALPLVVDVREEKQVTAAVANAVEEFGGIDILINNASAISLTGTLQTPMKRYDLMHSINGRGTFLMTQACLPHLLESKEAGKIPHILNNSPPLDMRPRWFGMSTAYTIAKYNMSMCALGHAEEFKDEIAVNTIWPLVPIWTAATQMIASDQSDIMYIPEIMSDAAYGILTQDTSFSGNFIIDQELLAEKYGITDFRSYQVNQDADPTTFQKDFFLPEKYD